MLLRYRPSIHRKIKAHARKSSLKPEATSKSDIANLLRRNDSEAPNLSDAKTSIVLAGVRNALGGCCKQKGGNSKAYKSRKGMESKSGSFVIMIFSNSRVLVLLVMFLLICKCWNGF